MSAPSSSPFPASAVSPKPPQKSREGSQPGLAIAILLLVLLAFTAGLFQLFKLRFEAGDVYPAYSSLRADPLGTMAFYESLNELPGITAARDFSVNNRLPETKHTAYLHLAARAYEWDQLPLELFKEVEGFVMRGGRFVVTFYPEPGDRYRFGAPPKKPGPSPPAKSSPGKQGQNKAKKKPALDPEEEPMMALTERWGLGTTYARLERTEQGTSYEAVTVHRESDLPLPESLPWHSGLVFTNLDSWWETIYARKAGPVLIQRSLGAGTIVMATDSYFLSNQALRQAREPGLLAWLVSPATRVVFDEAHHGLYENPGVAGLVRKYRLHGLVAVILLLATLFIWKNSLAFVPPPQPELPPGFVAGKDAASGFINLLRRSVPPADLLRVCFSEWTRSLSKGSPHLIARVDRAQALVETESARANRNRKPVESYREICHILKGDADPAHQAPLQTPPSTNPTA